MTATGFCILLCAAASLPAQQQTKLEGARELYYSAMVQKDPPPPVRRAPPRASGGTTVPITPVSMAAVHLGLRYNLVLVDPNSGRWQPAAPDRVFRTGECFALDIEANRTGFLYVLAKQSSGSWHPLLPSKDPDMATESNTIAAGTKVRIPLTHCFEIQDPPGVETLFVVLSREARDSFDDKMTAPATPRDLTPQRPAAHVEIADASIADRTVTRMKEEFGTRDIAIKKISLPLAAAEPAESVYVVNSSSSPTSNLAAQIEVHHR
jgi:Domain of unknown function (DUF4384)